MVDPRSRKFRQAAFVYLHVGILYLGAVVALARAGSFPVERGPLGVWMLLGVAVVALVFWGLWSWQNAWFARAVWAVHSLRVPVLIQGAFLPAPEATLPPAFHLTALVVVLVNLAALARAGWDL